MGQYRRFYNRYFGACLKINTSGVVNIAQGLTVGETDVMTKFNSYAPLASPTFTGTPTAPTPATADNSTKLATTAYVHSNHTKCQTTLKVSSETSETRPGLWKLLTSRPGEDGQYIASLWMPPGSLFAALPMTAQSPDTILLDDYNFYQTFYTKTRSDERYAQLDSPALTGSPTAPTQATADNSTKLATTAYVQSNLANYLTTTTASSTYQTALKVASASSGLLRLLTSRPSISGQYISSLYFQRDPSSVLSYQQQPLTL